MPYTPPQQPTVRPGAYPQQPAAPQPQQASTPQQRQRPQTPQITNAGYGRNPTALGPQPVQPIQADYQQYMQPAASFQPQAPQGNLDQYATPRPGIQPAVQGALGGTGDVTDVTRATQPYITHDQVQQALAGNGDVASIIASQQQRGQMPQQQQPLTANGVPAGYYNGMTPEQVLRALGEPGY